MREVIMIEDILTVVDGTERSLGAVDTAIGFARQYQAQLALSVLFEQVPVIAAVDPMSYGMALNANCDVQQDEMTAIRDKVVKSELAISLTTECLDAVAFPDAACRNGLAVDLAVIGPASSWCSAKARRRVVEELVLRAGTPTIVFPTGWEPSRFSHAVLGWNNSPEASRAARALIPLLEPGATIDILIVDESKITAAPSTDPSRAIGDHLARHGFAVESHLRSSTDGLVIENVLEQFARARGAQLLAVGGYSHSRLREGLLGGVTRSLIDAPGAVTLLAG
jgi:nucleotide-binding universal stress UspA family protein